MSSIKKNYSQLPQLYLRVAAGIGVIIPVLDRIGWLGPAGSENIGWGNWDNFLKEERQRTFFK